MSTDYMRAFDARGEYGRCLKLTQFVVSWQGVGLYSPVESFLGDTGGDGMEAFVKAMSYPLVVNNS
jgi:hypothetical protein